jgi:hydroxymethylbilane synthase
MVLGTRGSDLARAQTGMVEAALRNSSPDVEIAIEIITTRGDENSGGAVEPVDRKAGRKGMFTGEIERALLERKIDVAVHSAKDMPSDATPGLEICGALPRAPVEDVLITKSAATLWDLPKGATVATGSVRRSYQLRWLRSDLQVVDLRGNVPTRLRKLTENPWDAIILARAGLERLGFAPEREEFDFAGPALRSSLLPDDQFLPAGGQGVVALQIRHDDNATRAAVAAINHDETLLCLRAEREFLRRLQGDCDSPVGVLARIGGGQMTLRAQVFTIGDAQPHVEKVSVRPATEHNPEAVAAALFQWMYGQDK